MTRVCVCVNEILWLPWIYQYVGPKSATLTYIYGT